MPPASTTDIHSCAFLFARAERPRDLAFAGLISCLPDRLSALARSLTGQSRSDSMTRPGGIGGRGRVPSGRWRAAQPVPHTQRYWMSLIAIKHRSRRFLRPVLYLFTLIFLASCFTLYGS